METHLVESSDDGGAETHDEAKHVVNDHTVCDSGYSHAHTHLHAMM